MKITETADILRGPMINNASKGAGIENKIKYRENYPGFKTTKPEYKEDILEKIIDDLNRKLNTAGRELRCSVHEASGKVMVKVIETDSGKIIREIPPEKSLDILVRVLEQSGLLINEKT